MNKGLAGFNRFMAFLGFLVFGLTGALLICLHYDVPQAQTIVSYADQDAWRNAPDSPAFVWVMGAVGLVALILGLWLIITNFTRRSIGRVHSSASNSDGSVSLDVSNVASAVADSFTSIPHVEKAKARVNVYRNRPTMDILVTADPRVDVALLSSYAEQADTDLREAIRDVDVDTRYRFHLNPVVHQHEALEQA